MSSAAFVESRLCGLLSQDMARLGEQVDKPRADRFVAAFRKARPNLARDLGLSESQAGEAEHVEVGLATGAFYSVAMASTFVSGSACRSVDLLVERDAGRAYALGRAILEFTKAIKLPFRENEDCETVFPAALLLLKSLKFLDLGDIWRSSIAEAGRRGVNLPDASGDLDRYWSLVPDDRKSALDRLFDNVRQVHQLAQMPFLPHRANLMMMADNPDLSEQTPGPGGDTVCGACGGSGRSSGCPGCNGKGRIWRPARGELEITTCAVCGGTGRARCDYCGGTGKVA